MEPRSGLEGAPVLDKSFSGAPVLLPSSLLPVLSPAAHAGDVQGWYELPTHDAPEPCGSGFEHVRSCRPGASQVYCAQEPKADQPPLMLVRGAQ